MGDLPWICDILFKGEMVSVAQLVRALDCGPSGRGFKSHHSPQVGKNMTTDQKNKLHKRVAAYRRQPLLARRKSVKSVLVDRVASSMAMEREPVSKGWIKRAKAGRA